jgi:hypothetical protein
LTPEQVDRFVTDGFVFPVQAVDPGEAAALATALRRYEVTVDACGSEFLRLHKHFPKVHLLATWADRLVHEPRVLDAVESLIGPDILAWSSGIFVRPAHSAATLAWHQDIAYFGLSNFDRAVRVWFGLTSAGPANGTMRFAPRTHREGIADHGYSSSDAESIARGEEICIDIDESQAVDVVLEAGECSLHHLALAHCSGPNSTDADRVNFTVDYIAPEVIPSGHDSALTVRGRDTRGYYVPERRPAKDFGAAELRGYFDAVRLRDRRILAAMRAGA